MAIAQHAMITIVASPTCLAFARNSNAHARSSTMSSIVARLAKNNASLLALVLIAGCAPLKPTSFHHLDRQIAETHAAYRRLNSSDVANYNSAVAALVRGIDGETPSELRSQLDPLHVKLDQPDIKLPLARYHVVPHSRRNDQTTALGAPMLLEYDTTQAPFYPREGLMVSATVVYRRVQNEPHLSVVAGKNTIELNGSTYPLKIDNVAPITAMTRRGRHVARAGFSGMVDSTKMPVKTGIFLTEPYDPKKMPVLMVHGLQSTPFAFASLIDAIRLDPALNQRFQVWTFLYGTGTPVLFNAFELREQLEKTIRELDPSDRDFATRHIIVLGHSMGGLMAHTLTSSSGGKVWNALFAVQPEKLRGDPASIRVLSQGLHFRRSARVVRVIFAATPHRGSKLAVSWIGHIGESLIHLPSRVQTNVVKIISENQDVSTAAAREFDRHMNFSAVHTLSSHDPALKALLDLPIEVPFHSIIGQHNGGPIEKSSDGVVAYTSSHLDGAASELVVRSGHNVCDNSDAQREVMRILRLELQHDGSLVRN